MSVTRRDLLVGGVGLVGGASVAIPFLLPKYHFDRRPNLPGDAINTHPSLVLAAEECFRRFGAKSVLVAEGPGHQRDTNWFIPRADIETASAVRRSASLI